MAPPFGNAAAPPSLDDLTLRTSALNYPAIHPDQFRGRFRGQVALVTGSSRGIGKSIASALAEAGYSVAITARKAGEVDATVNEIQKLFPNVKVIGVPADGCVTGDLERLAATVIQQLGPIDLLICNAGTNVFMPFLMTEAKDWWSSLEINLKSPTELTRIVLPQMRERNRGTIIYTSSRAATLDFPWTTAYGCGKTAITRFAACVQNELEITQRLPGSGFEKNGISLFSIHPGEIKTSLHDSAFPERMKKEAPYILEGMKAMASKMPSFDASLPAWTVVYLASGKTAKLKGQYVDCTRDIEEQIAARE